LIPDSAHGTNPASCTLCGYTTVPIPSGSDGCADPNIIADMMDEEVAAIMLTNPNTLGLFEEHIVEIAQIVHQKGGMVYGDGANLNALLGRSRPGDMGIDVMHFNLHKTFSTPQPLCPSCQFRRRNIITKKNDIILIMNVHNQLGKFGHFSAISVLWYERMRIFSRWVHLACDRLRIQRSLTLITCCIT
jgi:hypothetical protein